MLIMYKVPIQIQIDIGLISYIQTSSNNIFYGYCFYRELNKVVEMTV